jgi:hypothetical protein
MSGLPAAYSIRLAGPNGNYRRLEMKLVAAAQMV